MARILFLVLTALAVPAAAQTVAVRSALTQRHDVAPGASAEGVLVVENMSDAPQRVRVDVLDYVTDVGGRVSFPEPAERPRSSAAWVSLPRPVVTVAPDSTVQIPYSIGAPPSDSLTGTYWAILMVQADGDGAALEPATVGRVRVRVREVYRYAVHVVAEVGGGAPAVEVLGTEFEGGVSVAESGLVASLRVDLRNNGGLAVRPVLWLDLYAADGTEVGRFDGSAGALYPGLSLSSTVPIPDVEPGGYTGFLYVDGGGESIQGFRLDLEIVPPDSADASADAIDGQP